MKHTIVLLQLEHRAISALLSALEAQCERMVLGEHFSHALIRLIMDYFCGYPDACHHPKEDAIFRRLKERAPMAADRCRSLLQDHEKLGVVTRETASIVAQSRDVPLAELVAALQLFTRSYREHIQEEESLFIPAAMRELGPSDWDAIDFAVFDRKDPLFDRAREGRYGELYQLVRDLDADLHHPPGNDW